MTLAWIVAAGVCIGLTLGGKAVADDGLQAWDERHLLHVRDSTAWASFWKLKFTDGIILESPGNLFILIPVTLFVTGFALWHRRLVLAVATVLCYVAARFLIWLGWGIWDRQRPDLVENGAAALSAHSFPSGHVILTMTTFGLLAWLWMRATASVVERVVAGLVLLLLVFAVGIARLRLGAHWPSDVIAGGIVGAVWLTGTILSIVWAERFGSRIRT
jgi:membrane-associated phospholipid phosphatase